VKDFDSAISVSATSIGPGFQIGASKGLLFTGGIGRSDSVLTRTSVEAAMISLQSALMLLALSNP
jgi:hypothetical protein